MKIIISPAKKMNADPDSLPCRDLPPFLPRTERLLAALRAMDSPALQKLWRCSDAITEENLQRLRTMDLRRGLTPALLAYEGIQYRYMAPGVLTGAELDYLQQHLRIVSGFYGLLRPFDGVTPYRLEMQARLPVDGAKDLYGFRGAAPALALCAGEDTVLNLASKEYSTCIARHLPAGVRMVTCVFGQEKNGKVVEKATLCKMARGEMVRYLAENRITDPDALRGFENWNYRYDPARSDETTLVFLYREARPRRPAPAWEE